MNVANTVLVLGASGLIGSACVRRLRAAGYKTILMPSHSELDLLNFGLVKAYFSSNNIDIVVLAAGKVGGILENKLKPFDFISENLRIQLNVCEAANQSSARKVVMLGSSCMYPKITTQPMPVSSILGGHMEDTSLPYAISKLAGLNLGLAFNRQSGKQKYIALIPNSAYGPGDNFNQNSGHVLSVLISKFHEAKINQAPSVTLWGTGTPRREFVFSDDIADAIIFAVEYDGIGTADPVNVGVGTDHSISELANIVSKMIGYDGKINWDKTKPDGAPQKLLDSSILRKFGWKEKYGLKKGLQITYDWYLENRERLLNEK